jgi:protein-S-isoprenylcysteine O-methyltransferase Ste14
MECTDMNPHTKVLDFTMVASSIICGGGSIVLLFGAGSFGYSNAGWSETNILLWDTFLSLVFFVQHSGMVRRSFRSRLASVVPTRYHGAVYSIASGIALTIVVLFWQKSQIHVVQLQGILLWMARLCALSAIAVFAISVYSLRSFDMFGIGPIRAHLQGSQHVPGPFVVRGAYRWVRHPFYSCILVLFWTNPEVTTDRLLFNVLWTGWMIVGTILEERDLRSEFGDAYAGYQKLVPRFFPWHGPAAIPSLGLANTSRKS